MPRPTMCATLPRNHLDTSVCHSWARLPPPLGAFFWDHQPAQTSSSSPHHQLLLGRAFCCEAPPHTGAFSWGQSVRARHGNSGAGRKVLLLLPYTSTMYKALQIPQKEIGEPQECPAPGSLLTGLAVPWVFGEQLPKK